MKVYVTRYALTTGIEHREVDWSAARPDMVIDRSGEDWARYYHGEGKDWHRDESSAVSRAEKMRKAKITSLEKSIAKLRALKFQ
jgi:hypothetical protein